MVVETFKFTILRTRGFMSEITPELQGKIMAYATKHIRPQKPNWVVFSDGVKEHLEDDGRTLVTPIKGLTKKVYAILDDYGEPGEWDKIYSKEVADELRKAPNCRFTLTFLLSSEY